jgi:urease accessory protein
MYDIHTKPIREPYVSDADLLTLVQWLSPAFPVGGFAYSHGLEWAISEG